MINLDDVWDFVYEASKILSITNIISIPALIMAYMDSTSFLGFLSNFFGIWLIIFVCVYVLWSTWLCR